MLDQLKFHEMTITWLEGGMTAVDGSAQFGVVPKPLWTKKYPVDELNRIETPTDPILIQTQGKNILIDTGVGYSKMTEKQIRNYGVMRKPQISESLNQLNLTERDIDIILMTHFHFDHAGGLTTKVGDEIISTYPNAKIYTSQVEWDEVRHPNIRSKNTYWKENWEAVADQVETFEKKLKVIDGIEMIHVGGHSAGLSIIKISAGGEFIFHMSDLLATHAHQNPLWVMAYDDYPMDSIAVKMKYMPEAYRRDVRFIFYHDQFYRMIRWDHEGKEIVESLKRSTPSIINFE